MSDYISVAKVGSIPEGESRVFTVGDYQVAVFNVKGEYHAINDFCPHMGASLSTGHLEENIVTCPWHAWRFDVQDGTWCDNPSVKTNRFDVRVEGEEILVCQRAIKSDLNQG